MNRDAQKERRLAVHGSLAEAWPEWVSSTTLVLPHIGGLQAHSRIVELRREGWSIETRWATTAGGARIAEYRLVSLEKGEPMVPRAAMLKALISTDGTMEIVPYAEGTKDVRATSREFAEHMERAATEFLRNLGLVEDGAFTVRSTDEETGTIAVRVVARPHAGPGELVVDPEAEHFLDQLEKLRSAG